MPIQTQTLSSASRIFCSLHLDEEEIVTPFTLLSEVWVDKEEPFCIQNINTPALMTITSLRLTNNKFYSNRK